MAGARGQVADSVGVDPPSFSDSALVRLPVVILQAPKSRTARLPYLDIPALLAGTPGAWVYDFGAPGWPDGWSPYGVDPGAIGLTLDHIPFDDPVTGRPDYELLPFDKLATVSWGALTNGRPEAVRTSLSGFESSRPLTEIVYRSTNSGLQQVSVTHAQTRSGPGNAPLQYLFAYAGAGARGEYEGSRLQRKRQLLLRLRRDTPSLRLELGEMFNRHRVGAHGGVQPFSGFGYESIYQRLGAAVENPGAIRQTSRNDLWFRAELPDRRTWIKTWWTVGTLTHRLGTDTTVARVSRLGIKLGQPIPGKNDLEVTASAFRDTYPDRNAWTRTPASRFEANALVSGRNRWQKAGVTWSAGVTAMGTGIYGTKFGPAYAAEVVWDAGRAKPFLTSRRGVVAHSASDLFGFGPTVKRLGEPPIISTRQGVPPESALLGRQSLEEVGLALGIGPMDVRTTVFSSRTSGGLVRMLDIDADTMSVVAYQGTRARTGATARIGLRDASRRGAYAWVSGTWSRFSGEDPDLDVRLRQAVPEIAGTAVLGIRGLLFKDDLDGDLSVRVRGWSAHRGLRLHAATGLLALPDPSSRPIAESFVVDIVGIAHIRRATLTLSMENILSGTNLVPGNQLVPDYPYPARRLRFSVYWPIWD